MAPGILHAPGTALTLELQESSDMVGGDLLRLCKLRLFRFLTAGNPASLIRRSTICRSRSISSSSARRSR